MSINETVKKVMGGTHTISDLIELRKLVIKYFMLHILITLVLSLLTLVFIGFTSVNKKRKKVDLILLYLLCFAVAELLVRVVCFIF